jgi:hypothetical protein
MADLQSGVRERLLPDFRIEQYNVSPDGQRVVFVAVDDKGHSPVWIAPLNGQTPPKRIGTFDGAMAFFGAPGEVVFGGQAENLFIYRAKEDGSQVEKLIPTPALLPFSVSPDGRWVVVMDPSAWGALVVYPAGGGRPRKFCTACSPPQGIDPMPSPMSWSPDGRFAYMKFSALLAGPTYAIPLEAGQSLPPAPPGGFPTKDALATAPGVHLVSDDSVNAVYPGPNPSIYAFTKLTTQRNIYRVPVQ